MSWDYEARFAMGINIIKSGNTNGNVRDQRAEHNHQAVVMPNTTAIRDLMASQRPYEGRHRAAE